MKQLTIRQLRASLSDSLKDLPFEITSRGRVIAVVTVKGVQPEIQNIIKEKPEKIISQNLTTNETPYSISQGFFMGKPLYICPHGYQSKCPICK